MPIVTPGQAPAPAPAAAPVYDISGEQPVLGELPHDQVTDAVASGQYSLPKGEVNVISPDGTFGTLPADQAPDAFKSGYKYATPDQLQAQERHEKYGTTGQKAITALEGAGEGALSFIAPTAERMAGVSPKDIQERAKENPWSHGLGEVGGFAGSLMTGTGVAPILAKTGEVALNATRVAEGLVAAEKALQAARATGQGVAEAEAAVNAAKAATSLVSRASAGAIKMGAEMATLQAGDEVSNYVKDAPNSVGGALTNIGMAGLIGGVTGGALSGTAALAGKAIEKLGLSEFTDRLRYRMTGADPSEAITKEFGDAMDTYGKMNDETWGAQGLKAQALDKVMPEMSEKLSSQVQEITTKADAALSKMAEEGVPQRYIDKATSAFDKYQETIYKEGATPGQIFDATQEFKSKLQGFSKGNFGPFAVPSYHEAYDFLNITKGLGHDIRTSLEDSKVWGGAADLQKNLNKAFSELLPTVKDAQSKFMSRVAGEHVLDPSKIQTYLNQNGKTTTQSIRQQMMGNFIDKFDKYQKTIGDIYEKAGIENPHQPVGMGALRESLNKVSPWAKAADMWYEKQLSKAGGATMGSAIGGAFGNITGLPGAGWAGALLGGKVGEHVLPSVLQPLMEKAINITGYREAVKLGEQAVKGDKLIKNAAKSLFKAGAYLAATHVASDKKQIEKLDKQVQDLSQNPQKIFASNDSPLGHYMPGHAQEATAMIARTTQYLNSLRPKPVQLSPLDTKHEPTSAEMSKYNRQLSIAQNPISIVEHVKDGTLQAQDVKTLQVVSPALFHQLGQEMQSQMIERINEGHTVPYSMRQSLSLFLGQPLDSTMTPGAIVAAQVALHPQSAQQAPQQASQKKPSAKSMNSLGKNAKSYQTASQQAESDRSSRS